jgi:ubiquinone/menaquinone biosynthesis C-methylase UbiE
MDSIVMSDTRKNNCEMAYNKAKKKFRAINLTGGTHKLPIDATLSLLQLIQVSAGDVSWEVGCGSLELAFALSSCAEGGHVVAVDLGII